MGRPEHDGLPRLWQLRLECVQLSFQLSRTASVSKRSYSYCADPHTNRSLAEEFGEWLESDLKAVNQPERRKKTPWVVSFAHKGW